MNNSIETILSTLLSQVNNNVTKDSNPSATSTETTDIKTININQNEKTKQLQNRIEILKSIEPIVSEKNREHINFFIKILTIAKIISEIERG